MQQSMPKPTKTPSRLRFTAVMILGVYPIITGLLYALEPFTHGWSIWQRTLLIAPLMVSVIVWALIPTIHRFLGWFLVRKVER